MPRHEPHIRHVVANTSSYAYLTRVRPVGPTFPASVFVEPEVEPSWDTGSSDASIGSQRPLTADELAEYELLSQTTRTFAHAATGRAKRPPRQFNAWKYGLDNLPDYASHHGVTAEGRARALTGSAGTAAVR